MIFFIALAHLGSGLLLSLSLIWIRSFFFIKKNHIFPLLVWIRSSGFSWRLLTRVLCDARCFDYSWECHSSALTIHENFIPGALSIHENVIPVLWLFMRMSFPVLWLFMRMPFPVLWLFMRMSFQCFDYSWECHSRCFDYSWECHSSPQSMMSMMAGKTLIPISNRPNLYKP